MDAPAARPALFRFARLASSAAADAGESTGSGPAFRPEDRAAAAWRGPVLACGVTIAATAGLVYAALSPEEDGRRKVAVPPQVGGGVILISAEEQGTVSAAAPNAEAIEAVDSSAEESTPAPPPVVTALHVWDGRPIRAVPTDTLPEAFDAAGERIPEDDVVRAGGATGSGPVSSSSPSDALTPAVWLTGEIAD